MRRWITPACSAPAPFLMAVDPAPGYIVGFQPGTSASAQVKELESRYNFKAMFVWDSLSGFFAVIDIQTVAKLRCEPSVREVEENANAYISRERPGR